ncbi:3959_t:CDS:2, partial [Acaulospora morrowiae]
MTLHLLHLRKRAYLNHMEIPINLQLMSSLLKQKILTMSPEVISQSKDAPALDITDNTSNSDSQNKDAIASEPNNRRLAHTNAPNPDISKTKSSEDKEIDEFLNSKCKEQVSKEIIQSISEKKLQYESTKDRVQNLISDISISSEQNHKPKNIYHRKDQG